MLLKLLGVNRNNKYFNNNVILLGDILGDLKMIEGVKHNNVIKICFLNEKVKKRLPEYSKHYDVLILNDGPTTYVNNLINDILKNGNN